MCHKIAASKCWASSILQLTENTLSEKMQAALCSVSLCRENSELLVKSCGAVVLCSPFAELKELKMKVSVAFSFGFHIYFYYCKILSKLLYCSSLFICVLLKQLWVTEITHAVSISNNVKKDQKEACQIFHSCKIKWKKRLKMLSSVLWW